jgi:uncharacterized protein
MTTFDLRTVPLRSGEQRREDVELALEPLVLAGQEYDLAPNPTPGELRITRASSGTVFDLDLDVSLRGPCFRCLTDAELPLSLRLREYQAGSTAGKAGGARREDRGATDPGDDDELRMPYLADDRLDLSAWARDAIALALPEKILCRPDCAGLCPVCGRDLNAEPHEHAEEDDDPRWAALRGLREDSG